MRGGLHPACMLLLCALLAVNVGEARRVLTASTVTIMDTIELDEISNEEGWDFEGRSPTQPSAAACVYE